MFALRRPLWQVRSSAPALAALWAALAVGAGLAVVAAYVLRGPGGGQAGSGAAQGALFTEAEKPDQA